MWERAIGYEVRKGRFVFSEVGDEQRDGSALASNEGLVAEVSGAALPHVTVAIGNHSVARALLAKLPPAEANQVPMKRLAGQLALWTGHAAEAVPTLEDVVRRAPADKAAPKPPAVPAPPPPVIPAPNKAEGSPTSPADQGSKAGKP